MATPDPVCRFCGQSFHPHPRIAERQAACSAAPCQAKRKRESQK